MKIPFEIRDIYGTKGAVQELIDHRVSSVPAFVIGKRVIVGFDRERILASYAEEVAKKRGE